MVSHTDQPASPDARATLETASVPIQASGEEVSRSTIQHQFIVNNLSLSYIFCFDFGSEDILPFSGQKEIEMIKSFTHGIYFINKDEIGISGTNSNNILNIYRSDMYKRRFKNSVLSQRKTLMLQFPEFRTRGIVHNNTEIISSDQSVSFNVSATLNEMGIGTLVFWLDLRGKFSFAELSKLREISNLNTSVDLRSGFDNKLRLYGNFSFIELAQFLIISLSTIKKSIYEIDQIQSKLSQSKKIKEIYKYECDKASSDLKLSYDIDFYPIYHFDFTNDPTMKRDELQAFTTQHKQMIRGLITGDVNWDKKKSEVIESFLNDFSFSTRDSIQWFTHPNGSIKMYSNDLETSLSTSKILITFELEIILTMKYFLYKLIHNINYFSEIAKSSYPIRSLSKLRDKEMRKLDDYYSVDFLQKDTTISRIAKFKEMMNIDMILEIAEKKIESLNIYTTTEYQDAIGWQQLFLTIIFGIFGAGNLAFVILDYGIKKQVLSLSFYWVIIITLVSMILSGAIILLIFRKTRIN